MTIYTAKWSKFFEILGIYENLPVFKASYDLLLNIYQFPGKFTREYKYTLGEKIKNETLELMVLVYRANSSKNKVELLQRAREQIELIRLMIRLVKDLKQISLKSFVRINQQVENVSKQLTGWQKSQK